MAAVKTYTCAGCSAPVEQQSRGRERRWCSDKCKSASRRMRALPVRKCEACSGSFNPVRRGQRACSRSCKDKLYGRRNLSPEASERQRLYWQEKNRRRRAAKRGGVSEPYSMEEIAVRDGFQCGLCGGEVPMTAKVPDLLAPTIDHKVPVSKGGDDTRANVQLAHFRCNSVKGARDVQSVPAAA